MGSVGQRAAKLLAFKFGGPPKKAAASAYQPSEYKRVLPGFDSVWGQIIPKV